MRGHETDLRALLRSLGRDGRGFERLALWFLGSDPEFRAEYRRVWLWDKWPGRWGRDRGIDLIAETHEGLLVAVQAKNYAERHTVTKRDLDTFLSESNRPKISGRLLIATTDRVASSARDVMAAQEKPVGTCLFRRLLTSPVRWPAALADLEPQAPDTHEPKPHQTEALDAIRRWAATGSPRAQVVMACGTGKTLVSVWAADRIAADRVLVLVPTLALLRQTAAAWTAHAARTRRLLRVCSDRSRTDDDPTTGDGLSHGGTTDPARIRASFRSPGPLLVLCTYDSSPLLAEALQKEPGSWFDLAVADEAHRCSGLESSSHKTILREDAIHARRRLFFTATPTIYGARDRGNMRRHGVAIASMDDPAKFGPVIHRLSFADAIERGLLCRYQVAVIPVDDDEVHRLIERRRLVTADGDRVLEAVSLATQIACARAMRRFACRRLVAFHPSIKDSQRFSSHFPTAVALMDADDRPPAAVWSEHVDGKAMSYPLRVSRLERFQATDPEECRLLSNVRLLAEGVDVPGIDGVVFVDTHRGQAAIIQAVGRAVRLAPGKKVGTIVLPVVLRRDETLQAALARSEHRQIIDVLGALRSHDPEIARSLDDLRFHAGPVSREQASGFFVVDAPLRVGEEFADAVDIALAEALGVRSLKAKARNRAAVLPSPVAPPSPDEAFLIGLERLRSRGRFDLLTRIPDESAFPMAAWWEEAVRRWRSQQLSDNEQRTIASSLSWLSPDLETTPWLRAAVATATSADVPEQVASQLRAGGTLAEGPLAELVDRPHQIDELVDLLRDVHHAITHAGMSPGYQAKRLIRVLHYVARAAAAATAFGDTPPEWYFLSTQQATMVGFAHALQRMREPNALQTATIHPAVQHAYELGAQAAQPLRDLVEEMALYRYDGDIEDVELLRFDEETADPDARLDALGWDIYLLMRARGVAASAALLQALDGPLRKRASVRRDLLRRARLVRR